MTDIVPELYKAIESSFNSRMATDPLIRSFNKRLEDGKATSEDVSEYAGRVGECASAALIANLKEENLPDGKLYWNIAERTIRPIFVKAHELINDAAAKVQTIEDEKLGLHLKPIKADFPEERVHAIISRLVDAINELGDDNEQS